MLDVAPNNSDLAYGISNTFATIPGIVGTLLSGLLLSNSKNPARDWRLIFWIAAAVYLAGCSAWAYLVQGAPLPQLNTDVYNDDDAATAGGKGGGDAVLLTPATDGSASTPGMGGKGGGKYGKLREASISCRAMNEMGENFQYAPPPAGNVASATGSQQARAI